MKDKKHPQPITEAVYPMRINKYLARENISTRRGADAIITAGKVKINGKTAVLGDKVVAADRVEVDSSIRRREYNYLAYNKKRGIVTSAPQEGETSIEQSLNYSTRVFPVGRLDKDSRGLIILTNDGRITERLLSPDREHDKEYEVTVNKSILQSFITQLGKGVKIGDYITKKCEVEQLDDTHFKIVLTEGKKHQIRRMVTEQGYEVVDLVRTRIMNIRLGTIVAGGYRKLQGEELRKLLTTLGLPTVIASE